VTVADGVVCDGSAVSWLMTGGVGVGTVPPAVQTTVTSPAGVVVVVLPLTQVIEVCCALSGTASAASAMSAR